MLGKVGELVALGAVMVGKAERDDVGNVGAVGAAGAAGNAG